eukprot:GEMP01048676.1.p1 GENE.GEMP01048676.1~~GEMP01048676.1.p1  ORF type:complete len:299 (+),score=86.92 GEMP01048676.1:60-956(+)
MSALREEIEDFIAEYELDQEAQDTVLDLEPAMQRELLARGPLTDARNPSAVVLSRVRQLKQNGKGAGSARGGGEKGNMQREIARFVRENDLDERAETCLKETDDETLRELFSRGRLTDARNPSAVVLSRLREIKKEMDNGGQFYSTDYGSQEWGKGSAGIGGSSNMKREIARFVSENDLDDRAETCLKEAETYVLRELFSRGPLTDARNPSAVVLSRLREIKKELNDSDRKEKDWSSADYSKGKGRGGKAEFLEWISWMSWDLWNSKGWGESSKGKGDSWDDHGKGKSSSKGKGSRPY